jgi:hypothetical protein
MGTKSGEICRPHYLHTRFLSTFSRGKMQCFDVSEANGFGKWPPMLPMIRINISLTNHLDMWKTYYIPCQLLMWNYYLQTLCLQVFKLIPEPWLCMVIAPLHSHIIHIIFNFILHYDHNGFFLNRNFFQHLSFLCTLINPRKVNFPQKSSKRWWSSQVNIYYFGHSLHKQVYIDTPFAAQILGRSTWINVSEIYKISQFLLCWIINMSVHIWLHWVAFVMFGHIFKVQKG